jgi:hypothetical protein
MQKPSEHQSRNQIENKISDTNKGHQSCGKYQQDTEIRAIIRSEQNEHIEKLKRTQFIMSGWEPTEIRQQQLSDESIGCIMAAIETGKDRPAWECFQWNIATTNLVGQIRFAWWNAMQKMGN